MDTEPVRTLSPRWRAAPNALISMQMEHTQQIYHQYSRKHICVGAEKLHQKERWAWLPVGSHQHQVRTTDYPWKLALATANGCCKRLAITVLQVLSSISTTSKFIHVFICTFCASASTETTVNDIIGNYGAFLLVLFLQTPLESVLALSSMINHCHNGVNCHSRGKRSISRGGAEGWHPCSGAFVNCAKIETEISFCHLIVHFATLLL